MHDIEPGSAVYVDSNVWIYLVELNPDFGSAASTLLEAMAKVGARPVVNDLVVAECLHGAYRQSRDGLVAVYAATFDDEAVAVVPIDGQLARRASAYGGRNGLKLLDAVHVTTAVEAGCRYFASADRRLRPPSGMDLILVRPVPL